MRTTWIASDHIISPLGKTTAENYAAVRSARSGITLVNDSAISSTPVYLGKMESVPVESINGKELTRFEHLIIQSIQGALRPLSVDVHSSRVVFILSTTKGNIGLLDEEKRNDDHLHLYRAAKEVSDHFGNPNDPVVISNACISGVAAMLLGKRLLESGAFDHAIVTGADVLSRFIVSGFQSLSALSPEPCRPFDLHRNGTTLGEAVATVVLTSEPNLLGVSPRVSLLGGAIRNDANHISGPSRTGEELGLAIRHTLRESGLQAKDIDFVSSHGTATVYNDEMEARAFRFAGLTGTPVNSLKGYFGHTLGAAGVVESVISLHGLLEDELLPTLGFEEPGVSEPINVVRNLQSERLTYCLKTASGFGGCNAAMILRKTG